MRSFLKWLLRTSRRSWLGLFIVLGFWAIAAKMFNGYVLYPWLDMPTHFAGGLVIANSFRIAIDEATPYLGTTPRFIRSLCVLGLTALTAVCWEFAEFLSDVFFRSHLNLGVSDTLSDLFFGITGGVIITAFDLMISHRKRIEQTNSWSE